MSRRKPRTLDARERALWAEVVKSAAPMRKTAPAVADDLPRPKVTISPEKAAAPIKTFRIGERVGAATASVPPERQPHLRMDKRTFGQLKRGKSTPEARIDLHGMTVADAHSALIGFLLRAQSEGRRLVLVITGKGRSGDGPIPERRGILRRQVPHWLELPPLSQVVLQVVEAHQRHGGSGAFYVYLRRR